MRVRQFFILLSAVTVSSHAAITVNNSSFNGLTVSNVNTAGLADWGYFDTDGNTFDGVYDNVAFDSLGITTASGSSSIGTVTLTENAGTDDVIGAQSNDGVITFDSNATFGSYGNFGPDEQDIWSMTFNDLGVGSYTISLYMGHSESNRVFDMDVSGTGITSFTTTSPEIGTLGSTVAAYNENVGVAYTYDIDVSVSGATDDLTLTFGGVSGGFGGAILAGYTVAAVPEFSTAGLLCLTGGALLMRRRGRS